MLCDAVFRNANAVRSPGSVRPQAGWVPDPHLARATARRTAQLAEAAAVVDVLPGPGESLHALMTGRYDLLTLAVAIIGKLGVVSDLHIATLAYSNRRNL